MDLLKRVFAPGTANRPADARAIGSSRASGPRGSQLPPLTPVRRKSIGLGHFFSAFPNGRHLEVLDLGGLSESNVNFLSKRGCRIHAQDLLANFDNFKARLPGRRFDAAAAESFVREYFPFPPAHFDAIFAWDCLEYLEEEVLDLTVARLGQVLRPERALLAFFHTQSRGEMVQVHRYQIEDDQTLHLQTRESRTLPGTFNNRSLERLFGGFSSMKFFLARDHLREVIAVR